MSDQRSVAAVATVRRQDTLHVATSHRAVRAWRCCSAVFAPRGGCGREAALTPWWPHSKAAGQWETCGPIAPSISVGRRYNPEEPPVPAPPAPCYTCATIAPRFIFLWRSTTLICCVVPPKPPSPPPHQRNRDLPPNLHFRSFLGRSWSQEHQQYASAFRCCSPPKQPKPSSASPSADMHVLKLSASCERFPLSTSSSGTSTRSAAPGIGNVGVGGGDGGGDDDDG